MAEQNKKYRHKCKIKKNRKTLRLSDKYEKLYRKMKPQIIKTIEKKAKTGNKEYIIFLINCYKDGHHAIERNNLKAAEYILLLEKVFQKKE